MKTIWIRCPHCKADQQKIKLMPGDSVKCYYCTHGWSPCRNEAITGNSRLIILDGGKR